MQVYFSQSFPLRDNDFFKVMILEYLNSNSSHEASESKLGEKFHISNFRIKNILSELQNDLKYVEYRPELDFKYERGLVSMQKIEDRFIYELRLDYLRSSNTFKVIQYVMFEAERRASQDFLLEEQISQPNFYHVRKSVLHAFNREVLNTAAPSSIHNYEMLVRRALASLYHHYFLDIADPFPEIRQQIEQIIQLLRTELPMSMNHLDYEKLSTAIGVQLMRIQNGHTITSFALNVNDHYSGLAAQIRTVLDQNFDQTKLNYDIDSEVDFMLTVVHSQLFAEYGDQGMKPLIQFDLLGTKKNKAIHTSLQKILRSSRDFRVRELSDDELESKVDYMMRLTDWLLLFDLEFSIELSQADYDSMVVEYPQYVQLVDSYVHKLVVTYDLTLTDDALQLLTFNLLLGFLTVIPRELVVNNINVALQFANNFASDAYIRQVLSHFPSLNLSAEVTPQTDIVISDEFCSSFDPQRQLVWPAVPTKANVEELKTVISGIMIDKLESPLAR